MLTILFLSRFVVVYIRNKKQVHAPARYQPKTVSAKY